MDDPSLKPYLSDDPPSVVRLEIEPHFSNLSERERGYAHWMSRYVFSSLFEMFCFQVLLLRLLVWGRMEGWWGNTISMCD